MCKLLENLNMLLMVLFFSANCKIESFFKDTLWYVVHLFLYTLFILTLLFLNKRLETLKCLHMQALYYIMKTNYKTNYKLDRWVMWHRSAAHLSKA